jgi:hypothetical protein
VKPQIAQAAGAAHVDASRAPSVPREPNAKVHEIPPASSPNVLGRGVGGRWRGVGLRSSGLRIDVTPARVGS